MMNILSSPQSYPGTDDELLPMEKQKLFREDTSSAEDGENESVQPWKARILRDFERFRQQIGFRS